MSFKVEYVEEYLKYENDLLKNYFGIIMSLLCSLNFNDSLSSTLLYALCLCSLPIAAKERIAHMDSLQVTYFGLVD